MPLGLPLGIPFNNTRKYNARNGASPCTDNLLFWQGSTKDLSITNKVDKSFAETQGNCKYYSGSDKSEITNNIVAYCDTLSIAYSLDGIEWLEWNTGDAAVSGLFNIVGTILQLGYDGTDYFTGYISRVTCIYSDNERIVLDFTLAEGDYTESVNRAYSDDIEGYLFPMSILNNEIILDNNLILS